MILHKVIKYIALLLSLIAMGFFFYTLAVGDEAILADTDGSVQGATVTPLMWLAYITLALTIIIVLIFVVKGLFTDPEALKKAGISVGLLVLIAIASYLFADDGTLDIKGKVIELEDGELLTPDLSKLIGASIYMFYILAVVAIGTVVWSGASKLIKR